MFELGTPITQRRAYGPIKKADDNQQTTQNTQTTQKQQKKDGTSIYTKDKKGNPQITQQGQQKADKRIAEERQIADQDHDKFMKDMFGDCF